MMGAALALSLTGLALLGQASTEPYVWPLDLPRELTSSFAEYRPGRYHMGIDLRTGPVGKNVYAADDGQVVRISCSPYGYGKVIYLQVRDGRTIVYAHLDEFMPPLSDYVRRAQHARKSYTVNLYPEAGELPVERGQLIAKSGQTGIGVPHLHYEIRDANGVPVNPGLLGIQWPDSTAPVFRKVAVVPLEPESTVNGDSLPLIRDLTPGADGIYRLGEIGASGPIGFAVDVYDPAPGGSKLGPYRLTVSIDGEPHFHMSHEHLSYDHLNDGAAAYEPALRGRGQFLWLWRKPGNESEIYPRGGADGSIVPKAAASEVKIVAEDFAGNRAELAGWIRRQGASSPSAVFIPPGTDGVDTGRGQVTFDYTGAQFVVTVGFDAPDSVVPVLHVDGAKPDRVYIRHQGLRTFRIPYRPDSAFADTRLRVEHPRVEGDLGRFIFLRRGGGLPPQPIDFGDVRVDLAGTEPYGSLAISARRVNIDPANEELTPMSPAFELWPPDVSMDGSFRVEFPIGESGAAVKNLMVYRRGRSKWESLGRDDSPGAVGAKTSQLGTYAVMADTVSPKIRILEPGSGSALGSRRPELKAEITDGGSGVDTFNATLNGQWLLMEYDPEQDLLRWERDVDLPPGPATLTIEVTDRAGNAAQRQIDLMVPN